MFERIIVSTDLSDASDRLINCLHGLRPLTIDGGTAILVHALGLRHLEVMQYELERQVESKLQAQRSVIEEQGFRASVKVLPGIPAWEVNRAAREENASLIMIGSHGATWASEMLLGGCVTGVIHHAEVPVLVIQFKPGSANEDLTCDVACVDLRRHVLYPTDFSDNSERAFTFLERIVESGARRVTLLHVQDQVRLKHLEHRLEEFNRIDLERLTRLQWQLMQKGAEQVEIKVVYGSPIQEIVRCADQEGASLIVMGSQGRGYIASVFLGSVSHHVTRQTCVPVLLIPALR